MWKLLAVMGIAGVVGVLSAGGISALSDEQTSRLPLLYAPASVFTFPGAAPCNTTLQACINGVAAGSTIQVVANTYNTSITINKALTLTGLGAGPGNTKLHALAGQRVITVTSGVSAGVVISNLQVEGGASLGAGGGISVAIGSPLTLMNANVMSNTLTSGVSGGGIAAGVNSTVTLVNVNVINNSAPIGAGGGLRASGAVVINGGRFERNTSINPGGAMRVDGLLTMNNVTVISNTATVATTNGGGVRADGGLRMTGGLVQNNVAGNDGGGIYGTALSISGTSVISNAGNDGGGVYALNTLAITNTLIDRNKARAGSGGGVFASSSAVTITLADAGDVSNMTISNNQAITNGGGVFAAGNVLLAGDVSFSFNSAVNGDGGAIDATGLTDSNSFHTVSFAFNTAGGNGGAIRALGNVRLLNSTGFSFNTANLDGGGINANGNVFLSLGASTFNKARNGGAVYALGDAFFNVHATTADQAMLDGGCAYAAGRVTYNSAGASLCTAGRNGGVAFSPLTVTLQGNGVGVFHDNHALGDGGVAFANRVEIRQASVFSNTASSGGAAAGLGGADVSDSTITSNTARFRGGAVTAIGTGSVSITTTLFTANRVTDTAGLGGAVWVTGSLNVSGSTFLTNTINGFTAAGGAAGASGLIALRNSHFQGNTAAAGGAVFGRSGVTALDTLFTGNGAINNRSGGGIAAITVTLSGVTMTKNNVCCTNASGGAVSATLASISGSWFIQNSAFISGGAVIANQVFVTASQFLSNSGVSEGAGIWTRGGIITSSVFTANSTGCCSNRAGGALFVRGTIIVNGSQFTGNESDHGGAINLIGNSSEIHDSTFTGNFVDCCGGGGAIDAVGFGPFIYNSTFAGNSVDCCDDGGAVRGGSFLYVENSGFEGNSISTGSGGAIFQANDIGNNSTITGSTFISNSASQNGGAISANQLTLQGSTLVSNTASLDGGGLYATGGASASDSLFDHNTAGTVNTCTSGGAINVPAGGGLGVAHSTFTRNQAGQGGGIACGSSCTVDTSSFSDNAAVCLDGFTFSNLGYGGAIAASNPLTVKRSDFSRNLAGAIGGGAIAQILTTPTILQVENSLFVANKAINTVFGAHGAAIAISNTTTSHLIYNTIVSDTLNPVSAIAMYTGTLSVIDNIITGHATGIERIQGNAFENFNLYFANTTNLSGTITSGGSSFNGNPLFVAPGNYHLATGSPAIDAGSSLDIQIDFDGDTRPIGGGFEIGFDETAGLALDRKVFVPVVTR